MSLQSITGVINMYTRADDSPRLRTESAMLDPVASYIRRKGYRRQRAELQFYEYRIDLYGFSRDRNETLAVELKLRNWRRAVEQALLYQLCADRVFIALPTRASSRVDPELLRLHGIGLIAVSDASRCLQVIPALPSNVVRCHYRDTYIEMLLEPLP